MSIGSLWRRALKKFSKNERFLGRLRGAVEKINALEPAYERLSDDELRAKTDAFKKRLKEGAPLNSLLVEAFATVREASKRTLGQRHFDVQLMGGMVLHRGMITEMKTGEGKTLVATLPVYLNALTGKGVHVVTVNDYLARRDAEEMGRIYKFLGMSVGCIVHDLDDDERRQAYAADITYGTNNEYGFDYLRDNMKFHIEEMCQRPFNYAIVDEVDSILIDEARTPLIISGPAEASSELYVRVNALIPKLQPDDYEREDKHKSISLTDKGTETIERLVKEAGLMQGDKLYETQNVMLVHHINQALKAYIMFTRDVDYIVKDGEVIIIDEFTGRMMQGRRYSDGLHQALEAKEGVEVEVENQTLASITFQNYFLMYPKLAGMTGTAITEAHEFEAIYKLQAIEVPTNRPMIREDLDDEIYRTYEEKANAVADLVEECHKRKQPVLVGTISIEKSEYFSELFKRRGIPHNVLNARQHEQEAMIIAQAGVPGAVTIATNMAGRGTDIQLGGNAAYQIARISADLDEEAAKKAERDIRDTVAELGALARKEGGLYIVGTERHESRRIDNQLRGRSGRQGDPGKSKFFISLQDDLMRIFGPNLLLLDRWFGKMDLKQGEPISHPWISKSLEKAQQRVEAQNFDTRKHLLKYAEVMNSQRKAVYSKRLSIMSGQDLSEDVHQMVRDTIGGLIELYTNEDTLPENWDIPRLKEAIKRIFGIKIPLEQWLEESHVTPGHLAELLEDNIVEVLKGKEQLIGVDHMRYLEKALLLRYLDASWKEHINVLEHLRQGVHLQAYGQKDPLNVYKQEGFLLFKQMLAEWREKVLSFLCHFSPQSTEEVEEAAALEDDAGMSALNYDHPEAGEERVGMTVPSHPRDHSDSAPRYVAGGVEEPASRNAPCPCGSGKRYKHCHGAI